MANRRVRLLPLLLLLAIGFIVTSRTSHAVTPCTDGIFFGNVTPFYQAILGDDNHNGVLDPGETPSAYYNSMPQYMKNMVNCGADPAHSGPDSFLYRQRPVNLGGVVRDKENRIIARVYDYLDPVTKRFYVAVVLSGCYTDNVFGKKSVHPTDEAYQLSVFWEPDHTHASNEGSDQMVGGFRCNNASGAAVYNYAPEGIELDLISLGVGSSTNDEPEAATWVTNIESPKPPGFPAAMQWTHSSSSWWNMEMRMAMTDAEVAAAMQGSSYWDLEDNSPPGGGDERPTDGDWKSPFTNPSNLFGQLGWGTTWFSDQYLWEWQHVYEFSFESDACSGTPNDWFVAMSLNTHASPNKRQNEICGVDVNQGSVTVIKDSIPDDPWDKYNFFVTGPTPVTFTLQDPGSNECPADPLCGNPDNVGAWTKTDRITTTNMIASANLGGAPYRVQELNPTAGSTVVWECKNAAVPLTAICDPANAAFNFDMCTPAAATCAPSGSSWADGYIIGTGSSTESFELCSTKHVICRFVNESAEENESVCLGSENAVGDLQVLGGVQPEQVTFTTAAVPSSSSDAPDSIFLASFVPIADETRWPGTVYHFIQPLPVVEDDQGNLHPDSSEICVDAEDTSCLAWDAGVEILEQAPNATEVLSDRQIGTGAGQRRLTYSKAASGTTVPRAIRGFDYSGSDALADEQDLWLGMGIAFVAGDTSSEAAARAQGRNVIRATVAERTATVEYNPDTGETRSYTYVLGDVFHSDPYLLGGPANFFYLANDLEGNGRSCTDTAQPNKGYRCFFEKERRRRKVLLTASNDGQLHAFDAGFFAGSVQNQKMVGEFDLGTGRELFAHIPRPMLVHTRNMVTLEHDSGIDGQLTVDDAFIDPAHNGTPTAGDRQWRTVVLGTYREGSRGLFALDLTHPDPVEPRSVLNFAGGSDVEWAPVAGSSAVPECSALAGSLPSGCNQPYPSVLWEFEDSCSVFQSSTGQTAIVPCDDDANGFADLADSWSKPNTGRVLVIPAGESTPVAKFVSIFGGGIDPDHPELSGNFLYMVDVETGKAIYKAPLIGAVPSEPAAVDTDQNGFLDTIYVGTTSGFLYKMSVGSAANIVAATGRINHTAQWTPFKIFDTGGREIFFRPTVIYEGSSGHYALGFGTGDREDLWSEAPDGQEGRFYLILDPGFAPGVAPIASGPLTESNYQPITADDIAASGNFLTAPVSGHQPGWVLELGEDERVVTDALAIAGFLAFTTFDPERPDLCTFGGNGNIYGLLATNANAIGGPDADRSVAVEGFAGKPVVTPDGFQQQDGDGDDAVDPFETVDIAAIRDSLTSLFPSDCRFGSFSLNVSTSLSSQTVMPLAQIPICIARKNWTEQF